LHFTPTLLIHGEQDSDVPIQQSALMSEELARHGVAQHCIALPTRGHIFDIDGAGMKVKVLSS
jgi:dipeptidyl aminopeptidase/acylaminoacyl peptidase